MIRRDKDPWGDSPGIRLGGLAPTDTGDTPMIALHGLTTVRNPLKIIYKNTISKALGRVGKPVRVLQVSSWREQCGISEYTRTLTEWFPKWIQWDVLNWKDLLSLRYDLGKELDYDIIHFQYEPGLVGDMDLLDRVCREASSRIVFTAHYYDKELERRFRHYAGLVIVHNKSLVIHKNHFYMVQGCPVFDELDRKEFKEMRRLLGIPLDARAIGSFGFLSPWKDIPGVIESLAPYIHIDPELSLVLLHSIHPGMSEYGTQSVGRIFNAIAGHRLGNRVIFLHGFLDKPLINRYLQCCNIGMLYSGQAVSLGSSAVSKEFVAARCPLVVSDTNHYGDLEHGVERVSAGDMMGLIYRTLSTLYDDISLNRLRDGQRQNYESINYRRVALLHAHLYQEVLSS